MKYDDKFRASAVVMLQAAGYPENQFKLVEIANHLGIPDRTLRRWYKGENNPPPDYVVTEEKKALDARLEEAAHKLLSAILQNVDNGNIQQQSVSLGILIEKMQLLRNEPTSRVAHDISDNEREREISQLLDTARARAATLPTPSATIH